MQDWLTYDEAADRLGVSAEAIRCRAKRQRWHRTRGNDGRARVQLPDDLHDRTTDRATLGQPGEATGQMTAPAERLVAAMQAHIETLQADVALARSELAELRMDYKRLVDELLALKAAAPPPAAPSARRKSASTPATEEGKAAASERMRQILERLSADRQAS